MTAYRPAGDNHNNINGVQVGSDKHLITQFADDTTITVDGSEKSLLSALNNIEIFGAVSGLKMDTSKTKLIWIGSKEIFRRKNKYKLQIRMGCY